MKTINSLILLILASQLAFSQQFEGKISEATQNGLHQIALTPAVRSFSDNNTHFIRIYDAQKNEVPYLVYKREITESSFVNFPILSKTAVPNVSTSVIISNKNGVNISSIILKIANTKVPKNYSLSGSNDSLKWFGLINDERVYNLYETGKTFTERTFTFPLNSYKYLKFNFIDKNSLPINVLEVGIIKNAFLADTATTLNNFEQKISTDKATKKTTIHIAFEQPQVLNGIKFDISAPNLYVRNAQIVVNRTREVKKKEEIYQETLDYLELNSKSLNQFSLGNIFEKEFSIIIENEDNPALTVDKITFSQNPISLLADLKANEKYTIFINPDFKAPNYDLEEAGINFNQEYPSAAIENINPIIDNKEKTAETTEFWQTPMFMWICIVAAIVIIGFFSFNMIKDLNKEK